MTANDSWRNINDLYFRIPKVDKRKNVVEISDEEEYVAEEEERPQVKLLEGKWLPGEDGFQFNKKCILQVKGEYLEETPRKKVTFDTFVEFDGEEENLCQQVEAYLNDDCIAEAEAMLFYGEKYSQAMRDNPDAKCYYKFKAHNNACRNDVESELLEMPTALKLLECSSVPGVTFELGKSFIRPTVAPHLQQLELKLNRHPDAKIIVFGHTDKTDKDLPNKLLSERRAESVYAFITNNADIWEKLYNKENWGLRAVQIILKDLGPDFDPGKPDNAYGQNTQRALKNYQTKRGLTVTEVNDKETRAALFKEYMTGKHDVELTPEQFMDPKVIGCGEFNPLIDTQKANETNRRVTFYLYHKTNLPSFPCKGGDLAPCKAEIKKTNPRNRDTFTCSFYDIIAKDCPCETPEKIVEFNCTLFDTEGEPLKEEEYILDFSGYRIAKSTDTDGKISAQIPSNATSGTLIIRGWETQINFNTLKPASDIEGAQTRLSNLGFYVKDTIDGNSDEAFERALQNFQNKYALSITGTLDQDTTNKLVEIYGE